MKHTKQEKQLINEWLEENQNDILFFDRETEYRISLEQFQKQHNLIDDELEVGKWYTNKEKTILINITSFGFDGGVANGYGFMGAVWSKNISHQHNNTLIESPESYVIERLTWYAEEVMKYNHEKPNYKCLYEPKDTTSGNVKSYELNYNGDLRIVIGNHANIVMKKGVWAETFEVEEEEKTSIEILQKAQKELNQMSNEDEPIELLKPAYKSKGGEHGKRIIDKLVDLGGVNRFACHGKDKDWFYFINEHGEIDLHYKLPQGYTECYLEEEVDNTITIKIPKGLDYKIEAGYETEIITIPNCVKIIRA
jgi:hypothetical protein